MLANSLRVEKCSRGLEGDARSSDGVVLERVESVRVG